MEDGGGTHLHGVLLEGAQCKMTCTSAEEGKLTSTGCSYAAVCTPLAVPLLHARILHQCFELNSGVNDSPLRVRLVSML